MDRANAIISHQRGLFLNFLITLDMQISDYKVVRGVSVAGSWESVSTDTQARASMSQAARHCPRCWNKRPGAHRKDIEVITK